MISFQTICTITKYLTPFTRSSSKLDCRVWTIETLLKKSVVENILAKGTTDNHNNPEFLCRGDKEEQIPVEQIPVGEVHNLTFEVIAMCLCKELIFNFRNVLHFFRENRETSTEAYR